MVCSVEERTKRERLLVSLLLECLEFAGELIFCRPILEMGWLRLAATGVRPMSGSQFEFPEPFRFRVLDFFSVAGRPRGVLGRVEDPGHPFDALFVVAGTGEGGPFGLEKHLCTRWDIEVGEGPIFGEGYRRIEMVSHVHTGFGVISSSQAALEQTLPLADEDSPPQRVRQATGVFVHRVLEQVQE